MAEIALVAVRPAGMDRMCFIASTQRDRELLDKANIVQGQVLIMKLRLLRSGPHHRLVFAMLRFVFENQEVYKSEEDLREALTLCTSFTRTIRTLGGRWQKIARSWSYEEMDEAEFSQLASEIVDVILTKVYPGEKERWLRSALDQDAFAKQLLTYT